MNISTCNSEEKVKKVTRAPQSQNLQVHQTTVPAKNRRVIATINIPILATNADQNRIAMVAIIVANREEIAEVKIANVAGIGTATGIMMMAIATIGGRPTDRTVDATVAWVDRSVSHCQPFLHTNDLPFQVKI